MTTDDQMTPAFPAECGAMATVRKQARALAQSALPIFVRGEPGTGRSTLARQIAATRAGNPDEVVVLQPSESILSLDKIVALQAVLVERVGELSNLEQNILSEACSRGLRLVTWGTAEAWNALTPQFRTRLRSGRLDLPPLRNRGAEIVAWARYFAGVHRNEQHAGLTREQEKFILAQTWTGNLPQLEKYVVDALQYAVATHEPALIGTPPEHAARAHASVSIRPLAEAVEEFRAAYIKRALEHFGGNRTQTARALGVDPRTIFRYLEEETK